MHIEDGSYWKSEVTGNTGTQMRKQGRRLARDLWVVAEEDG